MLTSHSMNVPYKCKLYVCDYMHDFENIKSLSGRGTTSRYIYIGMSSIVRVKRKTCSIQTHTHTHVCHIYKWKSRHNVFVLGPFAARVFDAFLVILFSARVVMVVCLRKRGVFPDTPFPFPPLPPHVCLR